jgi:hypothetical protein
MKRKRDSFAEEFLVFYLFVFAVFLGVLGVSRGIFVSSEKAQVAAIQLIDVDAVVGTKHVYFVNWRGCDEGDAAMFEINPFVNQQGVLVENVVLCSGWPLKGFTPRVK